VNEALVLLIRERSMLVHEQPSNRVSSLKNSSFISKNSAELLESFKDLKEESQLLDICSRSRSTTPNRISLQTLFRRLVWKLGSQRESVIREEEEDGRSGELLQGKQRRAELLRKECGELRQDFGRKDLRKASQIREKMQLKRQQQVRAFERKVLEAN